jgi:hypothetical protein
LGWYTTNFKDSVLRHKINKMWGVAAVKINVKLLLTQTKIAPLNINQPRTKPHFT